MSHSPSAVHRTILVVDVEGFGGDHRTNPDRLTVRNGLYEALQSAFLEAGIAWSDCDHEDRGDGVFVLLPPAVAKSSLIESLPGALVTTLCRHNATHRAQERIRLRMALHAGEITYDDHGATGTSINLAFRLLDAGPLKLALSSSPGVLAVIVSSWFFDEVVRHSAADPSTYQHCQVVAKETSTTAWICLPDHPYLPMERAPDPTPADSPYAVDHLVAWRRRAYVNHDHLFGAAELIALVADTIANSRVDRVTSVVGDGGIGKTATTYEAVRSVADGGHFTRIAWASAATSHSEAGWADEPVLISSYWLDVLKEMADQLGFDLGLSRAFWRTEFGRQVNELGSDERVLIVVDNLEILPDATDVIRQLRGMGVVKPHTLLVTTRWELRAHLPEVAEFRVRPLDRTDSLSLIRHLGTGDPDLRSAGDRALDPILEATEGNPFLIRLTVQQYLSSHRPLQRVLQDLRQFRGEHDAVPGLAGRVRSHLYTASLQELERRCGENGADALLAAFCVKGQGDAFAYDELAQIAGIDRLDDFDKVLTTACQLSIVTSFGDLSGEVLDRNYTIHSLLYGFTCELS